MPAPSSASYLSDADRRLLESWRMEFERSWDPQRLGARVQQLPPPGDQLRPLLLTELVKIDLRHHWQEGRRVRLESYLKAYPELGTPEAVAVDLIQAEFEARRQKGETPDLAKFAARFPRQFEELRRRLGAAEPSASDQGGATRATRSLHGSTAGDGGPAAAADLPESFGRYRILRKLGQGGMGTVYLAHDSQLDRPVALKVPHFSATDGPEALERFYREARAAALIVHANICPVYDVNELGGVPYVTMAYIEGRPLAELIRAGKPLPQRPAAATVRKLALALHEAHRRGVVHRDLKPSNVMINSRREPVVMDFGLAWRLDREDARLTKSGSILGTPAYMSPEQVRGDVSALGPGCDIYSLGVLLYEMLTCRLPFQGSTATVLGQILTQDPPRPSAHRMDLDPALEAVCLRAMARSVEDRYSTMGEMAEALGQYLRGSAPGARSGDVMDAQAADPADLLLEVLPADVGRPVAPPAGRTPRGGVMPEAVPIPERPTRRPTTTRKEPIPVARPAYPEDRPAPRKAPSTGRAVPAAPTIWRRPAAGGGGGTWVWWVAGSVAALVLLAVTVPVVYFLLSRTSSADYQEGVQAMQAHDYAHALTCFDDEIRTSPRNALAYAHRGNVHRHLAELPKAADDLSKAIELNRKLALAYAYRGDVNSDLDHDDAGLADCNQAIQLNKNLGIAYAYRGLIYLKMGDFDKAVADCEQAVQLSPEEAEVYHCRGLVREAKGEGPKARQDWDQALQLDPALIWAYVARARQETNAGNNDLAVADCDMALVTAPNYAWAYAIRGLAYWRQGNPDDALNDCDEALRLNPKLVDAFVVRGFARADKADFNLALDDFNEALRLCQTQGPVERAWVYHARGQVYAMKNDLDRAISDFEEATRLDPFEQKYQDDLANARNPPPPP
jgi:tetratricopeptide (TPR) repeat protein/predicted Ser/Thr protein kinase